MLPYCWPPLVEGIRPPGVAQGQALPEQRRLAPAEPPRVRRQENLHLAGGPATAPARREPMRSPARRPDLTANSPAHSHKALPVAGSAFDRGELYAEEVEEGGGLHRSLLEFGVSV